GDAIQNPPAPHRHPRPHHPVEMLPLPLDAPAVEQLHRPRAGAGCRQRLPRARLPKPPPRRSLGHDATPHVAAALPRRRFTLPAMPIRRATLVLSGGGTKGAFQVGAEQVLREQGGYEWERIFGVSVGALNGLLLAQGEYQRLLEVWHTIRQEDAYRKVWWPIIAWRLAVLRKAGIYDASALRKTIQRHAAGR